MNNSELNEVNVGDRVEFDMESHGQVFHAYGVVTYKDKNKTMIQPDVKTSGNYAMTNIKKI